MRNYQRSYLSALGYTKECFIPSELSGERAVDLHHIECKGMGGNPLNDKDRVENIIALTREEHEHFGDKKQYMAYLYIKHYQFLEACGVRFDKKWMVGKIQQYENEALKRA